MRTEAQPQECSQPVPEPSPTITASHSVVATPRSLRTSCIDATTRGSSGLRSLEGFVLTEALLEVIDLSLQLLDLSSVCHDLRPAAHGCQQMQAELRHLPQATHDRFGLGLYALEHSSAEG